MAWSGGLVRWPSVISRHIYRVSDVVIAAFVGLCCTCRTSCVMLAPALVFPCGALRPGTGFEPASRHKHY